MGSGGRAPAETVPSVDAVWGSRTRAGLLQPGTGAFEAPGLTETALRSTAADMGGRAPPTAQRGLSRHIGGLALLACTGAILSVLITLLQTQHKVTVYPLTLLPVWVPVLCSLGAVIVGYVYPLTDAILLERPLTGDQVPSWPGVIRACGVFLGLNYGSSKLSYEYSVQLALALALVAVGVWYFFDRTPQGFVLGLLVAVGGTLAVRLIVSSGAYMFVKADFVGIRSWIPCVFFAAGIVFGAMGRRLAVYQGLHFVAKAKPV